MKFFAKKVGMTHIYDEDARHIGVTVLDIAKTVIVGKKTVEKDGYSAYILGKTGKTNNKKSFIGQISGAANIESLVEDRQENTEEFKEKEILDAQKISVGDVFEIKAVTKGKGFTGTVKRHGFTTGPKTHGSNNYRQPGSIGPTYPQRVIKGRKMAGKMGAENTTVKKVKVLGVDVKLNRIMVKGSVPGPNKSSVILAK